MLKRVSYSWKCSCWVEIDETTTPRQIREQIAMATCENNEDIDEGPNDVRVLDDE